MEQIQILSLLGRIYPAAASYAAQGFSSGAVKLCAIQESEVNPGVFLFLDQPDYGIGYLSCAEEAEPALLAQVRTGMHPYLDAPRQKDLYFNLYGRNPLALVCVQGLGFQLELHGFKLARSQPVGGPYLPLGEKPFELVDLPQAAQLVDAAYADLSCSQGLDPERWQKQPEHFHAYCTRFVEQGGFRSYFMQDQLVGICLFRGSYIVDLAVAPAWQGQGLGREILRRVTSEILSCGADRVSLDVDIQNTPAQRFYARLGFEETGCFADHSLMRA